MIRKTRKKILIAIFLLSIFVLCGFFLVRAGSTLYKEKSKAKISELRFLYESDITELENKLGSLSEDEALQRCIILGAMAMSRNDIKKGEEYFKLALKYAEGGNLLREKVAVLNSLATIESQKDNEEKCLEYLLNSREIIEGGLMKDNKLKIAVLIELGEVFYRLGKYKDSQEVYEQAYRAAEELEDELILAKCKVGLGYAYMKQSIMKDKAKELFESAGELYEKNNMISEAAETLKCLGNLLPSSDDKRRALYLRALSLYEQSGDIHGQGNCNFNLGITYHSENDYTKALAHFQNAMYFFTRSGTTTGIGIAQLQIGRTYISMQKYNEAEVALKQAAFMLNKGQAWDRVGETEEAFGDLYTAKNDVNIAQSYYRKAIERFETLRLTDRINDIQEKIKKLPSMQN